MTLAGFYVTLANTLVQMVHKYSHTPVSVLTIVFLRSLFTFVGAVPFMMISCTNPTPSPKAVANYLLLGVTGVISTFFIFLALSKIPVGDVTIILFTSPVYTVILSTIFLKESCALSDIVCGLCSFTGVLIMTRPTLLFGEQDEDSRELCESITEESEHLHSERSSEYLFGALYALCGSFYVAVFYVLNKVCEKHGDFIINVAFML